MAEEIKAGIYLHFKGNRYEVITVAKHCDSEEPFVVYKALYGEFGDWIRPLSDFSGYKEIDGKKVKRFTRVA